MGVAFPEVPAGISQDFVELLKAGLKFDPAKRLSLEALLLWCTRQYSKIKALGDPNVADNEYLRERIEAAERNGEYVEEDDAAWPDALQPAEVELTDVAGDGDVAPRGGVAA